MSARYAPLPNPHTDPDAMNEMEAAFDDSDDDFGGNDGYVEFGEIEERTVSVKAFVDLDGAEIADTLEFDEETETVPSTFCGDITSGLHDEQEYGNHVSDYFGCHNLMLKY